jgi:hypothetical protein
MFNKLIKEDLINKFSKPNLIIDWQNCLNIKALVFGFNKLVLQPSALSEYSDFSHLDILLEKNSSTNWSSPIGQPR